MRRPALTELGRTLHFHGRTVSEDFGHAVHNLVRIIAHADNGV
jgi:hypothetical protein